MNLKLLTVALLLIVTSGKSEAASHLYATNLLAGAPGAQVSELYTLSIHDASETLVNQISPMGVFAALAYDDSAKIMYASTTDTKSLYSTSLETGLANLIGPIGIDFPHALAFDPISGLLYATYGASGENNLFRIDPSSGASTFVGDIGMDWCPALRFRGSIFIRRREFYTVHSRGLSHLGEA